jgi:hypothetical protein
VDEVQPASAARDAIQYSMLVSSSIFRPQRVNFCLPVSNTLIMTRSHFFRDLYAQYNLQTCNSSFVAPGHLVLHENLACVEKSN